MNNSPWYSFFGGPNEENIAYYENEKLPWASSVENNWHWISNDLEAFLNNNEEKLAPYFNESMVSGKSKWKALSFMFWGIPFKQNIKEFSRSIRFLKEHVPGLVSVSVSMLEPGTRIKEHKGDTNAIMRCHIGVKIPAQLPLCGFKVGDEERSWQEGKLLVFNDASNHTAWNETSKKRIVLLMDVIRPEFMHMKDRICFTVLAALAYQYLAGKFLWLKRAPKPIKHTIHFMLKGILFIPFLLKRN